MQAAFTDNPPPANLTLELLERRRRWLVIHGAKVPIFARSGKPRRLVAMVAKAAYILSMYGIPQFIRRPFTAKSRRLAARAQARRIPPADRQDRLAGALCSRGYVWAKRSAGLAETQNDIPCCSAVIDGEIVLLACEGTPDFTGLPSALQPRKHELAANAFFHRLHPKKQP
jgi:hypothetical protein